MSNSKQRPIGVFDSGVGGLTNVRALMERLPMENIIYFGDTARVPYGTKSRATIETFAMQIVDFLLENDVKALVIACNTIAAVAGQKIRQKAGNMPVLDVISAGAEAALQTTKNNRIGIIATNTTVNSNAYARAIHSQNNDTLVRTQAAPLLVPLVEEGWLDHEVTRLTVREYLKPLLADDIDTLVLGCTHFPLLKPLIGREAQKRYLGRFRHYHRRSHRQSLGASRFAEYRKRQSGLPLLRQRHSTALPHHRRTLLGQKYGAD